MVSRSEENLLLHNCSDSFLTSIRHEDYEDEDFNYRDQVALCNEWKYTPNKTNSRNDTDLMSQNYEKVFKLFGKTSHREEILDYYETVYGEDEQYLLEDKPQLTRLVGCVPGDMYMLIGSFPIHKRNDTQDGRSFCSKEINAVGVVDAKIALDRLNLLNNISTGVFNDPRWQFRRR
jgi:hypothetical protein